MERHGIIPIKAAAMPNNCLAWYVSAANLSVLSKAPG
jgi:hypothetical protein